MISEEGKFKLLKFRSGSFPAIENQPAAEEFYIIKQGKVRQSTSVITFGEHNDEILSEGDFFGVISCMSQRHRLHTIQAISDVTVIAVKRNQFDLLIQRNAPVALKILCYFSHQLRCFNALLTEISLKSYTSENPEHLYDLGEYYSRNPLDFNHAAYAFVQYIRYCPYGENVPKAKARLAKIYAAHKNELKLEPQKTDSYYYTYDDGQIVFLEHEPGNMLFIIQSGEVKISKIVNDKEVLLNILKAGDIFGEMAILENKPRNATAVASGTTRLMAVSKGNFSNIVNQHPQIATRIITLLSDRIWFIHRHITNMMISDPETRLYDAMYINLLKDRVNIHLGGPYTFNMGFEDLLKFTGLQTKVGYEALKGITEGNKNFRIVNGKIHCNDISVIERKMNVIKRNLQIQTHPRSGFFNG